MNDIEITVTGNVSSDVLQRELAPGRNVTRFSIATSPRLFKDGQWVDGPTSFFNVSCFGTLGQNVFTSVHRGDPILVRGRVRVRTWEADGVRRTSVDIDADALGPDLRRGTATFQRPVRVSAPAEDAWAGLDPQLVADAQAAGLTPAHVQAASDNLAA